jgi:2'-5' RNA ligase
MPRLFFALPVPERAADDLDDLCEGVPEAHWMLDAGTEYHLTLSFLGEVHQHQVRDVVEAGRSIRVPRLDLTLRGVGVFPRRGEDRILWAGVEPNEALQLLQKILQAELRRAGLTPEKRKFTPHITLARLHNARSDIVADWVGRHLTFQSEPYTVREMHLLSSRLRPGGAEYQLEEAFSSRVG